MSVLKGLKICFLAGTLGQGGAERQLFYQLKTLKHCGAQPAVICFSGGEYWQAPIEALGIPVIGLGQIRSRLGRLAQILSVLRSISPAILQSAHFYTNLYGVAAARWLGVREVAAVRNDGIRDVAETGAIGGQLSLRLPRFLAANSKNAIRNIERLGCNPSKLLYLPNVVDTHKFSPNGRPPRDAFHLLMVGRLVVQKRFDTFLRVLSALREAGEQNIVGHIVGDGPDQIKLQEMAHRLDLGTEKVCFHGAVADIERLYRQVHLYLHLSDWEGMPNTILEAMACGLPAIASRVGGIPELVRDGQTGFLLEPDDEAGLLACTRQLMADEGLRSNLGRSARAFIEQNHALQSLPDTLEKFYEAILS